MKETEDEGAGSVSISEVQALAWERHGSVHRALVTVPCNHTGNYRHLVGHE